MSNLKNALYVVFPLFALLSACSSGGTDDVVLDENGNEITLDLEGVRDTRAITGLWDISSDEGDEGIDITYYYINDIGVGTYYDYIGDSFSNGENCYLLSTFFITSIGGNEYSTRFGTFTAYKENGFLVYTDEAGTNRFTEVEGVSVVDLNRC